MGWNIATIIVSNPPTIDIKALLGALKLPNPIKIDDQIFDTAVSPEPGQIYIGFLGNNLVISINALPFDSFQSQVSDTETALLKLCPESEICSLATISSINYYGFSVIKNGRKIRAKAGDIDHGILIDFGEPLPEELPILNQSKLNEAGERLYYKNNEVNPLEEHQVGEDYVFGLFKGYIKKDFDSDEVLDTNFIGFDFDQNGQLDFFDGDWACAYQLTEGYHEKNIGRSTNFTLSMKITGNLIKGISTDADKINNPPATINGILTSPFIIFTHAYPYRYTLDKDGNTKADKSKQAAEVHYAGLYDHDADSFRGTWHIDNSKCWGTWKMTRL